MQQLNNSFTTDRHKSQKMVKWTIYKGAKLFIPILNLTNAIKLKVQCIAIKINQ